MTVTGFCLRTQKETVYTFPEGIWAPLGYCEACQRYVDEPAKESLHVFEPSPALLEALKRAGELSK